MDTSIADVRHRESDRLPLAPLLALAMTGFVCIVTETLPAGLLPQIADGLHITTSLAGQTVTAYALGSALAAMPLTIATRGWRRRNVLLLTIVGFLVFNSSTALSSSFGFTLVARFFAGVSAGLAWSLLAGYARRMVPPHQHGKALAVAMMGTPVALSLGVPFGTWLGSSVGWRSAFGIMSALTVLLIVWVIAKVPDYPGISGRESTSLRAIFSTPGVRPVLGTVITWMLAHNILYTYVAPFIAQAGLIRHVDVVLLIFGVASIIGIWIVGILVDHYLRAAVLFSLATFAVISVVFIRFSGIPAAIYTGVVIWGLTFGGAATLLQTALADAAGSGSDVALSMNVVAWNSAIAGGGLLGGVMLGAWGIGSLPWALLLFLTLAFVIAWTARTHGFRPGPRTSGTSSIGH